MFETCISLSGPAGSESDNNQVATLQPGEPKHAGDFPRWPFLVVLLVHHQHYPVTFDTLGSTFDTVLAVYTGNSLSALQQVGSNDDIAGASNR